jgi:PPOX class probable F420-dependent enzyme
VPQIATNTQVTRDELLDFIRPRHHAIVMTTRSDGTPQASPVTCGVDPDGRIVVATYPERAKTRNARQRPPVSVLFLSDDFGGPWVQVDGTAEVLDIPDAIEPLVDYFRSISGEHPDWDDYREAMVRQGKSLLRVTPVRWGPVATGGFPARLALRRDPRPAERVPDLSAYIGQLVAIRETSAARNARFVRVPLRRDAPVSRPGRTALDHGYFESPARVKCP